MAHDRPCLGSAAAISGFTWFAELTLPCAADSSGIDTALFTYVAIAILLDAVAGRQWLRCSPPVCLSGFGGKLWT